MTNLTVLQGVFNKNYILAPTGIFQESCLRSAVGCCLGNEVCILLDTGVIDIRVIWQWQILQ